MLNIHTNSNSLAIDQRLILFLNLSICLKESSRNRTRIEFRRVNQSNETERKRWKNERIVWTSWFFHFTNKTDWLHQQIVYTGINKSEPSEKREEKQKQRHQQNPLDVCVCIYNTLNVYTRWVFGHVYIEFSWNARANEPCRCVELCDCVECTLVVYKIIRLSFGVATAAAAATVETIRARLFLKMIQARHLIVYICPLIHSDRWFVRSFAGSFHLFAPKLKRIA